LAGSLAAASRDGGGERPRRLRVSNVDLAHTGFADAVRNFLQPGQRPIGFGMAPPNWLINVQAILWETELEPASPGWVLGMAL